MSVKKKILSNVCSKPIFRVIAAKRYNSLKILPSPPKIAFNVLRRVLIDVGCVFLFLYMAAASIRKARGYNLVKPK